MYPSTDLTAELHADLYAAARRRAQELRRAAIADFWHGVLRYVKRLGAGALRASRPAQHQGLSLHNTASHNPTGV